VSVGVRPEHLSPADDGPLAVKVRAVEWLGHECLVFGDVGGEPVVVRQAGMATYRPGEVVTFAVDPALVTVFDADTTERLA
jgi:ABC-type sugar transport system ATPase subunit